MENYLSLFLLPEKRLLGRENAIIPVKKKRTKISNTVGIDKKRQKKRIFFFFKSEKKFTSFNRRNNSYALSFI